VTEAEYIDQLKSLWPEGRKASREVLSLAAEAVRDFPRSATLWFLRGRLLSMAPRDYIFTSLDAICSFQQAIELDPAFADAYEELGRCLDASRKDPEKAKEYYRKAARLRHEPLD
jgi:tetratricopeptide (TPR) repeat protein